MGDEIMYTLCDIWHKEPFPLSPFYDHTLIGITLVFVRACKITLKLIQTHLKSVLGLIDTTKQILYIHVYGHL